MGERIACATSMTEQHRQRTIRRKLSQMGAPPARDTISTGFPSLDRALGGGLPRGTVVELYGPPACGKSTLALQIAAHAGAAAWIDVEHGFHVGAAASVGAVLDRLPILLPDSAEQALDMALRLVSTAVLDILVIDSAAGLVPQLELEASIGGASAGLQGRVLASGLRRLRLALTRSGACVLIVNQVRTRHGPSGEDADTSAGGAALKLHAAVRIALNPVAARGVRFHVLKNKAATPFLTGELAWQASAGFVEPL
jgi:recombination protein RecA